MIKFLCVNTEFDNRICTLIKFLKFKDEPFIPMYQAHVQCITTLYKNA